MKSGTIQARVHLQRRREETTPGSLEMTFGREEESEGGRGELNKTLKQAEFITEKWRTVFQKQANTTQQRCRKP